MDPEVSCFEEMLKEPSSSSGSRYKESNRKVRNRIHTKIPESHEVVPEELSACPVRGRNKMLEPSSEILEPDWKRLEHVLKVSNLTQVRKIIRNSSNSTKTVEIIRTHFDTIELDAPCTKGRRGWKVRHFSRRETRTWSTQSRAEHREAILSVIVRREQLEDHWDICRGRFDERWNRAKHKRMKGL